MVGKLQQAQAAVLRAGKRAALVPEELALEQFLGNGAAIDRRERLVFALAPVMNRVRHQLLARPGFAHDQHVKVRLRGPLDALAHLLHDRALAQQVAAAIRPFDLPAQQPVLIAQPLVLQQSPHAGQQILRPKRLGQVIHRSKPHALDRGIERRVAGDNERRHAGVALPRLAEQLNAVELGHPNVRNQQIEALLGQPFGGP